VTRSVAWKAYEGKRGTTYRLRWRFAGQHQSITVPTDYDRGEAIKAIERLGCNITDTDPRLAGGLLWRGDIAEAEAMRNGVTFYDAGVRYIAAKGIGANDHTKHQQMRMLEVPLAHFRDIPVAAIDADMVNAWTAQQVKHYTANTVRGRITLVKSVLAYAARKGYRGDNPGHDIQMPKPKRRDFHLTDAQVDAILAKAPAQWRSLWWLLAETGLRIGEARALRVSDVHLDDPHGPMLQVNRAMVGTTSQFGPGKSEHALRDVWLDDETAALLAERMQGKGPDDLLWANAEGGPIHYGTIWYGWATTLRRAKVPKGAHMHDLRHWHLSVLLSDRTVPGIAVTERAGHSSHRITADLYGHVDREADALVLAAIGRQRKRRLAVVS
jgi:integrase